MKNLDLKNLDVQEMNVSEMTQIEGGGPLNDLLGGLLTSVVGTVNSVSTDLSTFLNKTIANVVKLVAGL
ncbi:hypothetical protein [Pedobacter rhizosphaerae]|uniref:Bacteriocin-type signal sequence-containing protein n=1 Tax=Pedobacter rhizosphaerae TaxID=390241 RepID=A0A1H9VAX8_9SPHI|nr:hypothetical protein [Pedobacter rhizosphaerae]SES18739.1 hypothetical protein SAMN04488023_14023 [Pedobacter rhizosphaerae]